MARREGTVAMAGAKIRFRIDRDAWEARRRSDIEIIGLDGCLDMFVGPSG